MKSRLMGEVKMFLANMICKTEIIIYSLLFFISNS